MGPARDAPAQAPGAYRSSYKLLNSLLHQTFPKFDDEDEDETRTDFRPLRAALDDQYNDLNFWALPPRPPRRRPTAAPASPATAPR